MKNRELFIRDPAATKLLNNGQARIQDALTDRERQTLREELSHFVCEGQYADGMLRMLESYLENLASTNQPAAWVSGFYGSGKSHLLKVLCHLWANTVFPEDGATARSLVPALPRDIEAALRELDVQGRRLGGIHAASGTLPAGGGSSVRLIVLGIVLRSKGLPESFPQAKFCLYLKNNGFLDRVRASVEAAGKEFSRELNNLYVSPILHDALIEVDRGYKDRAAVRELLKQDFPQRDDINTAEFIQLVREVLSEGKQLPCATIVLDEVQQFIGDSSDRATKVVEVAEALCKQLDSRVLLVGAGQTALSATPQLQKLRDRFTIPVELSDADVETVTRRVLLAKRPDKVDAVRRTLETHAGEIDRQLANTSIGPRSEDRAFLVEDYPLLPARRRFWEHALRAVDPAGTSGQLRTQLRIVYEALRTIAEFPLGTVVPADFMFEQQQPGLLQQGVLLREIDETIRRLDDGTEDGRLARRVCGLIFLIRKLPREAGVDIGVRANAETLADLLVSDIAADGAKLRQDVPRVLEKLVDSAVLLNVDGEYNLQTRESAEWDKEFRNRQTRLNNNEHEIHAKREAFLRDVVSEMLKGIKPQQGVSKVPRKLSIHFGDDPPDTSGQEIPIWIRDGWNCSDKEVVNAARAAGTDSPILFCFVPKASAEDLKKRIVDSEAARGTLDFKGSPSTAEGLEARDAMKTRLEIATAARDEIVRNVVGAAKVLKGGGTELYNLTFDEKVREGAEASLDRLFPRFREADHKGWPAVINRAKAGDGSPLEAVEWTGAIEQHPVCREILRDIGAGKDGRSVRRVFGDSPFGWPQDAIDGALIALHATGNLQVRHKGTALTPGQLDQNRIALSDLRTETITLSAQDKLKLRGLLHEVGIQVRPSDDLGPKAQELLTRLDALAQSAGGEPPLPERSNLALLDELRSLAGNEQLARIASVSDSLKNSASEWRAAAELAAIRLSTWKRLESLLAHARGLPEVDDLIAQSDAICEGRLLLDATDRVTPPAKKAADLLRAALTSANGRLRATYDSEKQRLDAADVWRRIDEDQRRQIAGEERIDGIPAIATGSDEELCRTLDAIPLVSWDEKIDALPQRFANAAMKAAKLLEPKVQRVRLTSGTLRTVEELKGWLSEQEQRLVEQLAEGPLVVG